MSAIRIFCPAVSKRAYDVEAVRLCDCHVCNQVLDVIVHNPSSASVTRYVAAKHIVPLEVRPSLQELFLNELERCEGLPMPLGIRKSPSSTVVDQVSWLVRTVSSLALSPMSK